MARSTTSLRLDDDLRDRLALAAQTAGTSLTAIVERFIKEGLDMASHPGVIFKSGPSGRRAALAGGPDIWEIASALRHTTGPTGARVATLASEFGIHERQVSIALDYAAAHWDEVEGRMSSNDRALDDAQRAAAARERLMA